MTQVRRRFTGMHTLQVETRSAPTAEWKPSQHLVALGYESPFTAGWEFAQAVAYGGRPGRPVLPFQPLSVRAFDSEDRVRPVSPLGLVPTDRRISVPVGAQGLDAHPWLGCVLAKPLSEATAAEARDAISAFVLLCEFRAAGEPEQPTELPTSVAPIAMPALELVDRLSTLLLAASINGQVAGQAKAAEHPVDVASLLAELSAVERLSAGELFAVDVFAGLELAPLRAEDQLLVVAPGLGRLEHRVI